MKSNSLKSIEVSFDKPISLSVLTKELQIQDAKKMGDKIRIYTDKPNLIIENLTNFARSKNLEIISLNTLAPTLEDVFIKLIKNPETN